MKKIESRTLFISSLLLTGFVLYRLPRTPENGSFSLLFVAWMLAILLFGISVLRPTGLKGPDWKGIWEGQKGSLLALGGILLAAFLLRIWHLGSIPFILSGDEASHGLEAVRVLNGEIRNPFSTGWLSVPTMTFYYMSLFIGWLGQTIFAVRLPAVLIGTLTIIPVFFLVRQMKGSTFALATCGLLAAYHYHIHFSRLGANQIADPLFATLTVWFLYRAIHLGKRSDWLFAGGITGLAFYFYAGARFGIVLSGAILIYHAIFEGPGFIRRHAGGLLIFLGSFLIVGGPMFQYALRFSDDFNARLNQVGILQSGWLDMQVNELGRAVPEVLFDQFQRAALAFNFFSDRTVWYGLREPLLDPVFGTLFLLGLGFGTLRSLMPRGDRDLFYMAAWWWGTILLGGMLTESPPSSQRLTASIVPVCFFITLAIWEILHMARRASLRIPVGPLLFASVAAFAWVSLRTYFVEFAPQRISGGPRAEVAMMTAPLLKELGPDYHIHFVGPPYMYWGFSTNPYLVPHAQATDVLDALEFPLDPALVPPHRGTVFIVVPERRAELDLLTTAYPWAEQHRLTSPGAWKTEVNVLVIHPR